MTSSIGSKLKSAGQNAAGSVPGLGSFAVSHASLSIFRPPAAAGGALGSKVADVDFEYNPGQVQMSRSASWSAQTAVSFDRGPTPEFHGAQPATMNIEVILDGGTFGTVTGGDVAKDVDLLMSCCEVEPQSVNSKRPSPPWVKLSWGSLKAAQFTAIMTSVNVTYTRFSPDGTPNRARCQLALQEVPQPTKGQNPTSGALNATRVHSVVVGDSLASLAWNEYGDPTVWRAIARANNIDDPMRLKPGRELLLPAAEEVGE
jgi:nucleoid-associated protein YgaU